MDPIAREIIEHVSWNVSRSLPMPNTHVNLRETEELNVEVRLMCKESVLPLGRVNYCDSTCAIGLGQRS